jgi:amino acid adenylation domain-containing protein/non-ribosomal peptide synthase protein (TIGR01720 family)
MSDLAHKLANLSPEKRALLMQRLKQQGAAYDTFPLTFAQQRMWFQDQLQPGNPAYNIFSAFHLRGPLNVAALEASLAEIARRHDILRSTFITIEGQPRQVVADALVLPVERVDLRDLPPAERDRRVEEIAAADALHAFDLSRGPLLRLRLLWTAPHEHVLLLCVHHIVFDGWSVGVFRRELRDCYAALIAGQAPLLPELPIQYADYAAWQERESRSAALAEQMDYWRHQLADLPTLELPTDYPRPPTQTFRGRHYNFVIPAELTAQLHALSRQQGATLFMTLLTAFQALLLRYTGQHDLAVGTPIAGRTRTETRDLIGLFVNTLVLRTDLSGEPSFREAVQRVRAVALEAYARQDAPFEQVVEAVQPERDLSRSPLFQVMFALQNAPAEPLELPGLMIRPLTVTRSTTKFDLGLSLTESAEGLAGVLEYSSDLFLDISIERFVAHFQMLLRAVVAAPDLPITQLSLLTAAESRQLDDWSGACATVAGLLPLHEALAEQAARTPDAWAIIASEQRVSYRELEQRANQLARYLQRLGSAVDPAVEPRVGVYLEREPDLVVALLAIWKAGAAYVPLDPEYPPERLHFMLNDAEVAAIITTSRLAERLPSHTARLVQLDRDGAAIEQEAADAPQPRVALDCLAYLIYTSGTSGQPKAVQVEHHNVAQVLQTSRQLFGFQPGEMMPWIASAAFDIALFEVFAMLLSGGTVRLLSQAEVLDLPRLCDVITECTALHTVPSLMRQLVRQLDERGRPERSQRMRQVFVGGDTVPPELLADLQRVFPQAQVSVLYGPTETTIICTRYQLPAEPPSSGHPIGRPLPVARIRLYDAYGQPVPIGVPGEIYIGGDGVTRGYRNRAELTREKFVLIDGQRWYRSGDRARYRHDGTLEFLGRADQQVKIRGYRIEPGEIEAVLRQSSLVREAIVLAREDVPGDQRLVAYVVEAQKSRESYGRSQGMDGRHTQEASADLAAVLRNYLKERLPQYMIPSAFVVLQALPLTANGKINRAALPAPDDQRSADSDALFVAPATPEQELIAQIWSELLGRSRIGLNDHFFALGGHSLIATQVIARIRSVMGIELPLRSLFESPTLAELSEQLRAAQRSSEPPILPLAAVDLSRPQPLSFAQQRLWFLEQLEPGSILYNMAFALQLTGLLDCAALESSIARIVERHAILRTSFVPNEADGAGEPVQVIADSLTVPLVVHDLQGRTAGDRERLAAEMIAAESRRPFDLRRGPLLRAMLLRLEPETQILLLCMHHIIFDGWSMAVFRRELSACYQAYVSGTAPQLPVLEAQYADYALWQRAWLQGEALERQLAYWRQQLADLEPLALPTDYPRPALPSYQGAEHRFVLPQELHGRLRKLGRETNTTLFMTLLAAFHILLHRYSGQADITVGTPIANRTRSETQSLIGFFVNQLVLRAAVTDHLSFQQLLSQVRETTLAAYAHQDLPFVQLVKALNPERSLSHSPFFQVQFILQNAPLEPLALPGIVVEALPNVLPTAQFDLTLALEETEKGLLGSIVYSTDVFKPDTIKRMAGHFEVLLSAVVADRGCRIGELPLLTQAERQQLRSWNLSAQELPGAECVHQLFEQQAARTPAAPAVVIAERAISYGDLDARAKQLAAYLHGLGVRPGQRVALCMERSIEQIIGIFGILKAGGAYVPLDPGYPLPRLHFMLEDSAALVLVTQRQLTKRLPLDARSIVYLDDDWFEQTRPESPAIQPPTADDPAYAIYTSGTTGQPKAVLVSHRNVVHSTTARIKCYGEPIANFLLLSSFAFDSSVAGIFWTLSQGGTLHLPVADSEYDPAQLAQLIAAQQISHLLSVPSLYSLLLDQPPPLLQSLRTTIVGGESCPTTLVERHLARLPQAMLFNEYGPTEATVWATVHACTSSEARRSIPIGRPIANTQVYILDRQMQPVPIGVPGEIYIGGAGLALGYVKRPDLTAERFVPDPFARPGGRLYKTGDLARFHADGTIEFLGRIDQQVKLRGFRIELGEIESALLAHPAIDDCAVVVRDDLGAGTQLVAYVVERQATPGSGASVLDSGELRESLQERLPAYMVPNVFVLLDQLPRSPNGKLDRKALPAPAVSSEAETSVAPRTTVEARLAEIWASVLRRERIGVHDNFFSLGGDSILSIQIIARASQAGLQITPQQMFQHQTIAELARVVNSAPGFEAEQGPIVGSAPLTPIQRWFFERELPEPHYYNQAQMLSSRQALDPAWLEQALQALVQQHDVLRLRFWRGSDGWQQRYAEAADAALLATHDLRALSPTEQSQAIGEVTAATQRSLDLAAGPLLRGALFQMGASDRLLLVVHHLAVDAVSWRILLEDLQSAYHQIAQGQAVTLPAKTTSFKRWAEHLVEYAGAAALREELDYWLLPERRAVPPLPVDHPHGANTLDSERRLTLSLDAEATASLLHSVPQAYRTQINDALLTALALAFARWSGQQTLLIDLEGHGREDLFSDVDLSRTVGWFTSAFPVLLDLRGTTDPGSALKQIKEQLRQVPRRGIGYGVLRYLSDDATIAALRSMPEPQISFNYLGQGDRLVDPDALLAIATEGHGPTSSDRGRRSHLLEVNSIIRDGQLRVTWMYSAELHRPATIERLAQAYLDALRVLISHCQTPGAGGYTPSDFPLARIGQAALDDLLRAQPAIVDLYPLTPLQQGILFHTLYQPGSGVYVGQMVATISGDLQVAAFQQAWQRVVDQHPILRTGFVWEDLEEPLQAVHRDLTLPWTLEDWREIAADERSARLAESLAAMREAGFDLRQPPLFRVALFHMADQSFTFVWTQHHLLLDGWSVSRVLAEVFQAYAAFAQSQAPALDPPPPFRNYLAWLQQQDTAAAQSFWRTKLAGVTAPTPLGVDRPSGAQPAVEGYHALHDQLDPATTAALQALARAHGLTINTLVQGVWAMLLSRYSGLDDVLFGATVAGRPAQLPAVERMVGMFINTLPVRVRLDRRLTILDWLQRLQAEQAEQRQYEYSALVDVQGWSEVPRGLPLFESLVVFANYPVVHTSAALGDTAGLDFKQARGVEQTNYPLTLTASVQGQVLALRVSFERSRFDQETIERLLGHIQTLFHGIAADPTRRMADLPLLSAAEWQELMVTRNATQAAYGHSACYHQLFEAQAARTPAAIAVTFGDAQLRYRELDERANQLAHYLQSLGIGPGARVGVCFLRSFELVVGLLGVFKAGAAFVPLDPQFPAERMSYILNDADVTVLLTQAALRERLPADGMSIVCLDADWSRIAQSPRFSPAPAIDGDHLAYLIYTSGSTGRPKGVLIPHRGLNNYLIWCLDEYTAAYGRGAPVHASIAADAIFPSLFAPLLVGASVMLLPNQQPLDALAQDLRERGNFSLMKITPSQLEVLNHQLPETDASGWVRTLVVGAEEVRGEVLRFWQVHAPTTKILNEYGPTETVVGCSIYEIPGGRAIAGTVPIGLPIANIQFYVLDAQMQPVPIGVPGELYIGGDGVAWGYHKRPELTAEKFVPDLFSGASGGRLYKTGDLVRWIADRAGNVEFLGRIDDQVKIRGYRVEPGEVAEVLRQHPQVLQAEVLARADTSGERRLVAYVVAENNEQRTENKEQVAAPSAEQIYNQEQLARNDGLARKLRGFLADRLPEYMVPSAFVFLSEIPLAPHGKIDRAALPAPESVRHDAAAGIVPPRDAIEERLVAIWQQLLGVTPIGVTDQFFDLGGHSLSAVRLMARIQQVFQRHLPLSTLFQATSIEQLAALLREPASSQQPLVTMRAGSGRPCFFVHAVGGDVLGYRALVERLEPDQPCYGLQAPNPADLVVDDLRIETMAAQYIDAIRAVQPNGPYLLCGWSYGGLIAYEMAQQLHQQNQEIELLALIDTRTPELLRHRQPETDALALLGLLREQALLSGKQLSISRQELQTLDPDAQMRAVLAAIKGADLDFDTELEWVQRFVRGLRLRERALATYRPQRYAGRVVLFTAADEPLSSAEAGSDPTYGWAALVAQLLLRPVPGNHATMLLEPHVAALAAELNELLTLKHTVNR